MSLIASAHPSDRLLHEWLRSNNKYSLLGAAAGGGQPISYRFPSPAGLAVVMMSIRSAPRNLVTSRTRPILTEHLAQPWLLIF